MTLRYDPDLYATEMRRFAMQARWENRHYRERMLDVLRQRRTCRECGLTSTLGGLASHQRSSGHQGWSE